MVRELRRALPPAGAGRGVHRRAASSPSGLLGDKRPRVLPPMEILFKDKTNPRPVYDYQVKQEWEKHVYYECPAKLTPAELKAIERVARETFAALDCRDVARVDLRMDAEGRHLRPRGQPAARPDARLLRPVPHRQGGRHRVPHADRRDPGRRPQAPAREARAEPRRAEARGARANRRRRAEARPNGNGPKASRQQADGNADGRPARRPTARRQRRGERTTRPGDVGAERTPDPRSRRRPPPIAVAGMRAAAPRAGLLHRPLPDRARATPSPTSPACGSATRR